MSNSSEPDRELSLPVTSYHLPRATETEVFEAAQEVQEEVPSFSASDPNVCSSTAESDDSSATSEEEDEQLSAPVTSYHRYLTTEVEEGADDDEMESDDGDGTFEANADEPLADEAWLENYERERRNYNERLATLQRRLDGQDRNLW